MSFTAPKFTNAGKELLSRALSGDCAVKFTSIALGSGELSSQAIAAMTGLIAEQKRVGLEVYQRIDGETVNVRGTFNNSELAAGFHWREVGLYAQNPDDPDNRASDILYCYQNAGDLAEYIPSVNDEVMEKTISLTTKISDAAEVTAILLSEVYATKEEVEEGYVKKTGDTMTGDLAISNPDPHVHLIHGNFAAGSTPTESKAATLEFKDATGKTIGVVQSVISPNGSGHLALWHVDASGAKYGGTLLIGTDKDGKPIFTHLDKKVITAAGGTVTGELKTSGGLDLDTASIKSVSSIEFETVPNAGHGGYLDFHFNGSTRDSTSRIIEDQEGRLHVFAESGFIVNSKHVVLSIDGVNADAAGNIPLDNVVHLSGNETISGLKTHTQNLYTKKEAAQVVLQNTAMTKGVTPDRTLTTNVIFGTSGGTNAANSMAQIYATQHSNGNTSLNFRVFKNTADVSTSKIFSLIYNLDDTTGIKWGDEQVVCVTSWESGDNWYRKYSDGYIEQGGKVAPTANAVSFNVNFSRKVYRIELQHAGNGSSGYEWWNASGAKSWTLTNFTAYMGGGADAYFWYACGY